MTSGLWIPAQNRGIDGMEKLNVVILFGGKSGEHDVSLESAASVYRAIDKDKYNIHTIGIAKNGKWSYCSCGPDEIQSGRWMEHEVKGSKINFIPSQKGSIGIELNDGRTVPVDVCFPVLHGPRGEDGTIQGLFEMAEIPYVGCKVLASSLAMDKIMFKKIMDFEGVPQVDYVYTTRFEFTADPQGFADIAEERLEYPMFTKPANMGSSVGISKVSSRAELIEGVGKALEFDSKVVVEQGISAREIEVAVLGNSRVEASVAGEIIPCKDFYDYEAKYLANESKTLIPAGIDKELEDRIREMAVKAFKAIDGSGISRIDFFVEHGSGTVYLNEINTMPGFTKISMYPKLWEASGVSYKELIDKLIQLAMEN